MDVKELKKRIKGTNDDWVIQIRDIEGRIVDGYALFAMKPNVNKKDCKRLTDGKSVM